MKKILAKKKCGEFDTFMIMFSVVFALMLFSMLIFKRNMAFATVEKVEDSLKAATLAGATADLREYGDTGDVVVISYDESYQNFRESLILSMDLGYDLFPQGNSLIISPVNINDYIIYNVRGDTVECIAYKDGGMTPTITTGTLGGVVTPNNVRVTKSTVYSSITFNMQGFIKNKTLMGRLFNMDDITVTKSCCADITAN